MVCCACVRSADIGVEGHSGSWNLRSWHAPLPLPLPLPFTEVLSINCSATVDDRVKHNAILVKVIPIAYIDIHPVHTVAPLRRIKISRFLIYHFPDPPILHRPENGRARAMGGRSAARVQLRRCGEYPFRKPLLDRPSLQFFCSLYKHSIHLEEEMVKEARQTTSTILPGLHLYPRTFVLGQRWNGK